MGRNSKRDQAQNRDKNNKDKKSAHTDQKQKLDKDKEKACSPVGAAVVAPASKMLRSDGSQVTPAGKTDLFPVCKHSLSAKENDFVLPSSSSKTETCHILPFSDLEERNRVTVPLLTAVAFPASSVKKGSTECNTRFSSTHHGRLTRVELAFSMFCWAMIWKQFWAVAKNRERLSKGQKGLLSLKGKKKG